MVKDIAEVHTDIREHRGGRGEHVRFTQHFSSAVSDVNYVLGRPV